MRRTELDYSVKSVRVITGKEAYVHRWMFTYDMQINIDFLQKFEKDMKALVTDEGDVVAYSFRFNPEIEGGEFKSEWSKSEAYDMFEIDFRLSLLSGTLVMFSLN